ncbi:MAG: DUF2752 domain-containing protein [Bacteroidia bacterium]|nr:DUF2752 domain-containing protein [Bacteroidia bacterium]NND26226.1 DUF2752 domain-containing protein [Flavobacteriaceae bacterium]MBT8279104.1 DUF2752 domain-containing protein [Bacteroidia bacterium]NNK61046.1 DUF2752 domain-containing protein [Flavobacteriaceae bacterium]NNL33279.1 DUF2752 domain-containing protein [Flavobacteriaceae bacterium]
MMAPEDYMIPCFWKKNFNIECMGCGIQRSLSLIFQGEFIAAFKMYPAIYTLIILFVFLVLHIKFQFKLGSKILLALFILNVSIIIISYLLKIT